MHFLIALAVFAAACYVTQRPEKVSERLDGLDQSLVRGCAFVLAVLSGLVLLWTSLWVSLIVVAVVVAGYQLHKRHGHASVGRHRSKSSLLK